MKTSTSTLITAIALILASVIPANAPASEGSSAKGGGDAYAQEFTSLGQIASQAATKYLSQMSQAEREALVNAVKTARVVSSDHLYLEGAEVDAINHPFENPPRVELSRNRWNGLKGSFVRKVAFAYHEYSVIAGVDDQRYAVSGSLLQKLCSAGGKLERMRRSEREIEPAVVWV